MANKLWEAAVNIFTGGMVQSVENVALEWIQTDKETEEAKAIRIKALDPNGIMRRDIMRFVCRVYGFYLVIATGLIAMTFFGQGPEDADVAQAALDAITSTFLPITGVFGALATASFGVNASNNWKDVKLK